MIGKTRRTSRTITKRTDRKEQDKRQVLARVSCLSSPSQEGEEKLKMRLN